MPHQYGMKNFKGTKAQYKKAVKKEYANPLMADLASQSKGMHQMPDGSMMKNSMMKKGKSNFCPTCGKPMGAQYIGGDMSVRGEKRKRKR